MINELKIPDEETLNKFFKYVKEEVPSLIYAILNTAKATYKPMAANINRCAINQRNWRMYRVDLGGNGRHRNIRKAIRLMANTKRPRVNILIDDTSSIDCEINERSMSPINKWLCMQISVSDKGPERGISRDFTVHPSSRVSDDKIPQDTNP